MAAVLNAFTELSGEFYIRLAGAGPYDRLPVEAELAAGNTALQALAEAVELALKDATGASAKVTLAAPLSLPRSEGKTRRVLREERS